MPAVRLPCSTLAVKALPFTLIFPVLFATSGCNEVQVTGPADVGAVPCARYQVLEPAVCRRPRRSARGAPGISTRGLVFNRDVVLEGGSFSLGCEVLVNDPTPDLDNQCTTLGTCQCADAGAGVGFGWSCSK